MYDFLDETTYDNDPLLTGELLDNIVSSFSRSEEPEQDEDVSESDAAILEDVDEEQVEEAKDEVEQEEDNPDMSETDMELIDWMFANENGQGQGSTGSYRNVNMVQNADISWLPRKTNNVNLSGLNPTIATYLNNLPENIRKNLLATSGNDDKHAKGSRHYSNNAIDLRYNEEAYKYMINDPVFKQMGLRLPNPDHGTAKHLHIETMQFGGVLNAEDPHNLRVGLNNPNYDSAVLHLAGKNTIRGLDNNQPVLVTDGKKYKVLVGNKDTDTFTGKVYEQRL